MSHSDDEVDIKTWNKLEDSTKKAGYRDGIFDGRQSNFQSSFDVGYKNGFETGFVLGFYKGTLSSQESKECNMELLKKTTRGNCQMCHDTNLESKDLFTLNTTQKKNSEELITELQKNYPYIKYDK